MNLSQLLDSLEKSAAEIKAPETKETDKPKVSKELDEVLSKEAAEVNAVRAFEDGEKLAREILEKLATDAISEAPSDKSAESQPETKPVEAPVTQEKTAETKQEEVKPSEQTKEAAVQPVAEEKKENKEEDMNKQAQDKGKELAAVILEKLSSSIGSSQNGPTVVNSVGAPANKLNQDAATLVAQHDARIGPTPSRNGTINQILDAIVAKARSGGAIDTNEMASGQSHAGAESKDPAMGTPSMPPSADVVEKTSAVSALVEAGLSWEDAVDLVKAAAVEIEEEEFGQTKLAAVEELMSKGIDFDSAVTAVQEAAKELSQ
jgi:hypothetical protein